MQFVITGNPITKKNSQRLVSNGRRPYILPSQKYVEYEKDAINQLIAQGVKQFTQFDFPIDVPVNVCCVYYRDSKRRVDLVNLLEATNDILTAAGVLADDNCQIAAMHDGSVVLYDKHNPRVEITITPIHWEWEMED